MLAAVEDRLVDWLDRQRFVVRLLLYPLLANLVWTVGIVVAVCVGFALRYVI